MPTTNRPRNLGKAVDDQTSRLDAVAKVTGSAKYSRDQYLPNTLFAAFIRCPHGAAKLESINKAAAQAIPGVVEVDVTGDEGQYNGHVIGHIAAESRQALSRALTALDAKWRELPVKTRIEDSPTDPPAISESAQAAIEAADHVLEVVYTTSVQTHSCFETHGSVVDFKGDSATVYSSTQGTYAARDGMGEALGLPDSQFEIQCEYIGGGFGSKLNGAGKEGALAGRLAAKYKRPVHCFVDRAEDHLDTGNRPSSRSYAKLGFDNDGTIRGGQIQTWGGVGVGSRSGGVTFPSNRYDLGDLQRNHEAVRFNGGGPRPFRAPGPPQGMFAEELTLDTIAATINHDPVALRLKLLRSDEHKEMIQLGADLIGWKDRGPNGSAAGHVKRGFGCGVSFWGRFPTKTEATVIINRDGSVRVLTGTQDIGTGQRTVAAVLVADQLGISLDHVTVGIGNSNYPIGPGSGGSMTAHNTAPALRDAAQKAKDQILTGIFDGPNDNLSNYAIANGQVIRQNEQYMSWLEACARMNADKITGHGVRNDESEAKYFGEGSSNGTQFVDLTVDTETGIINLHRIVAIQACGQVVVRKTAESQIIGAVTQGISYALFEHKLLDRNTGAMVNPNLEMYKIAGTVDMPLIEPILWTKGQTGVRSLGEPPTIPTAGAIACAVYNAIGSPVASLPLTPDKVLAAMEGGAQ